MFFNHSIMNFYRRARFASDAFRDLSSRIVTRAPVQEPTSRILQNGSSSTAKFSGFSSYSCFSKRLGFSVGTASKNYCNPVNGIIIGKRYYSVDRYWLENLTYVLVAFGAAITFYLRHLEARHGPEEFTRKLLPVDTISTLLFKQPFSWNQKIELEADYIGLMLLASAGYDPRVAPKALEKLDQFTGDKMNPSVKERAQLLAQAKVMEEALSIYTETRSGY